MWQFGGHLARRLAGRAGLAWTLSNLAACFVATACTACPDIVNPTGACETPSDGDHPGYSSAEPCSWVRDCNLQWKREYFRVYVDLDDLTTAFMVPRPNDPSVSLPEGLSCLPPGKRKMPAINDLTLTEALAAEHCLHDRLRFVAIPAGSGGRVQPMALPDDIADVCEQFPNDAGGPLKTSCEDCMVKAVSSLGFGSCPSIDVQISLAEAELLARRLNQVYGIPE